MASSSRVFTEFQDGNWRAPCLSTQHLMGILFQFSLIWKLNFTLSICFLASKVLLISLLFFFNPFLVKKVEFLLHYRSPYTRVSGIWIRTEGGIWSWLPSFYKTLIVVTFCFSCSEAGVHLSASVATKTFFSGTDGWHLCCLLGVEQRKVYVDKLHCPRPLPLSTNPLFSPIHDLPSSFSQRTSSTPWSKILCNDLSIPPASLLTQADMCFQLYPCTFLTLLTNTPFLGLLSSESQFLKWEKGSSFSVWSESPAMDKNNIFKTV